MALKLMYITNRPDIARIAESAGVDRIFVDMEYIGKQDRQGGMDTDQSRHTLEDVAAVRKVLDYTELLVRCNPIHEATEEYGCSQEEINGIVAGGADIIMLPYYKTTDEVKRFIQMVAGRARTCLLLETPEAAELIDKTLCIPGVDEILIGLNDLSLGYHRKFMFELLADGTVEKLCRKCADHGIPYGFGGIASLGKGMLPSEYVIKEHYRLGSSCAILSRSFCNVDRVPDIEQVETIFRQGLRAIREFEKTCQKETDTYERNHQDVVRLVRAIVERS